MLAFVFCFNSAAKVRTIFQSNKFFGNFFSFFFYGKAKRFANKTPLFCPKIAKTRGFLSFVICHFIVAQGKIYSRNLSPASPARLGCQQSFCLAQALQVSDAGRAKAADTRTRAQKESMFWLCCLLEQWILREQSIMVACWGHNEFSNKPCPCFDVTMWEMDWDERKMASVSRYMRINPVFDLPDEIDWTGHVARCRQFHESWFAGRAERKKSQQDGESRK